MSCEPRQHFVLPWLRLVTYPHLTCTVLYLPHVLNYCVQWETNPQASSPSTKVLPKGLTSMICIYFYLFYICDDVNTSLADLQKSTLLVKCRKILDPLKGQQTTTCVPSSKDMSERPCCCREVAYWLPPAQLT